MARFVKGRSRAYPAIDLEEACRLANEIGAKLGSGVVSRELVAEALGYSNVAGGPGARKIAALTQFGLLKRSAGRYQMTDLAAAVSHDSETAERTMALQRAFCRPPLFRAVIDHYRHQGRVPLRLAAILVRDHGITSQASRLAADVFMRSGQFIGVLTHDGALKLRDPPTLAGSTSPAAASVKSSEQRFEFVLTGGRVARLGLPLRLTRKDLDIVRRQLEFLEYQVMGESDEQLPDATDARD